MESVIPLLASGLALIVALKAIPERPTLEVDVTKMPSQIVRNPSYYPGLRHVDPLRGTRPADFRNREEHRISGLKSNIAGANVHVDPSASGIDPKTAKVFQRATYNDLWRARQSKYYLRQSVRHENNRINAVNRNRSGLAEPLDGDVLLPPIDVQGSTGAPVAFFRNSYDWDKIYKRSEHPTRQWNDPVQSYRYITHDASGNPL